jgi:hypothetical protein
MRNKSSGGASRRGLVGLLGQLQFQSLSRLIDGPEKMTFFKRFIVKSACNDKLKHVDFIQIIHIDMSTNPQLQLACSLSLSHTHTHTHKHSSYVYALVLPFHWPETG